MPAQPHGAPQRCQKVAHRNRFRARRRDGAHRRGRRVQQGQHQVAQVIDVDRLHALPAAARQRQYWQAIVENSVALVPPGPYTSDGCKTTAGTPSPRRKSSAAFLLR